MITKRFITINELLDVLPIKYSKSHIYARRKKVPGYTRFGGRNVFDLDIVEEWVENGMPNWGRDETKN